VIAPLLLLLCCHCYCCTDPGRPAGALVLSTGNATQGAVTSNSKAINCSTQQYGDQTSQQPAINADLQATSDAGYSQKLFDQVTLQFDVTPTNSGPVSFQYVFGSEEYPYYAPSTSESQLCSATACFH
jgi:hypothetical protein